MTQGGDEKNKKMCDMERVVVKKCHFLSNVLFEWPLDEIKNLFHNSLGVSFGHTFKITDSSFERIHNNAVSKLSGVMMYSFVVSIIKVFFLLLRLFDPKLNVSTAVGSFWFNKEYLMVLIFSKSVSLFE